MLTTPTTSLRRMLASTLTALAVCAAFSLGASAQTPAPAAPAVIASSATVLTLTTAQTGMAFAGTQEPGFDHYGNFVFTDYPNAGLFEIPVGTRNVVTLVPDGALGSGGYTEPSVTFDSANNMLIPGEFANCLLLFPWDPAKQTWDGLSTLTTKNTGAGNCATYPYGFANYGETNLPAGYIQPWGVAFIPNTTYPATGTIAIGNQNPTFLYTMSISYPGLTQAQADANGCDGSQQYPGPCSATAVPGNYTTLITAQSARSPTVAADPYGNVFFNEDISGGGLPGVYMVPAGVTNLAKDTDSQIVRIDPNLPNVTGVATDAMGNVYISDSKLGVYVVPADATTGSPDIAKYYLLTPVPATSAVAVDLSHGLVYFTTTNSALALVSLDAVDLGSTAVGAAASTTTSVYFTFDQAETPASFAIQEAGATTPDFAIVTGGTCAAGTAQAANTGCTVNVALDPQNAGNVSATLVALDGSGNVLGSFNLHGTGIGAAVNVFPGGETAIDAGLKTPAQVAVDAAGNTYVADSGLNEVLMFAKGSATGTAIGTGLKQPTGVAVDGAGDVFIADSGNGNVVEIPVGPSGLNAAAQITLKSGLGTSGLSLATDGAGHLYITDPQNNRVVKLTNPGVGVGAAAQAESDLNAASGYSFSAPSAVATDSSEDLYVADGANLIEITPSGTQSTVLTSLSGATGLAVDPSGSVYIAETGGVVRVPNVSGTLTASAQTAIAPDVTNPTSVALDPREDLYIADATNGDVDMVSASASTNFGTQATPTSAMPPASYTVVNSGNSALTVTGYSSTADYSVTAETCTAATPLAPAASCSATVTFNPGPGDSGALSGFVQVQGNEANQPVGVQATGVGATLAATTTTMAVSNPTVDSAPVVVTVTPATAGTTPAPSGNVTLTITGSGLTTPVVVNGTLSAGKGGTGTATLTPPQLSAGNYTFAVSYQGDRVYTGSKTSSAVTLAPSPILLGQPTLAQMQAQDGTATITEPGATLNSDGSCCATYGSAYVNGALYVLSAGAGSNESYDGTPANIEYKYPLTVTTTSGAPLIGIPVFQSGSNGQSIQTATNYGTVNFTITGPTSADTTSAQTNCSAASVNPDGTATFITACLPIDTSNTSIPHIETTYTLTPSYTPAYIGGNSTNPNYTAMAGTPFTVTALSHPMVVITANPSSLSLSTGSSASTTLTLTSLLGYGYTGANGNQNNYALPVDLQCDGLPAYATCSFAYPPAPKASQWNPNPDPNAAYVTPLGTPTPDGESVGPAKIVMTITTNIPTGESARLMHRSGGTEWATVFGLSLLGLAFGKRRSLRNRLMVMLVVLVTSGIVAGSTGCSTTQLGAGQQATPAGTYQVLVTARQTGSAYIIADAASQPWVYGSSNQVSLPFTMQVTIK